MNKKIINMYHMCHTIPLLWVIQGDQFMAHGPQPLKILTCLGDTSDKKQVQHSSHDSDAIVDG